MITNKGKDIIAKYFIGQAPSFASYIAIGCGAKPSSSFVTLTPTQKEEYANATAMKTELEFEMFRIPIVSRGYVTDIVNGEEISKVVLTAELPTEQRYGISEIGIYSARNNPSAIGRDSRIIYTFGTSESWEYHDETNAMDLGATFVAPLYGSGAKTIMNDAPQHDNVWIPFRLTSDNSIFNNDSRTLRYEQPRFLNTALLLPGDMSYIDIVETGGDIDFQIKNVEGFYFGRHIHYEGITLDLSQNSASDQLKLAFTVMNRDADYEGLPSSVRVLVEFASDELITTSYAKFQAEATGLAENRYVVFTQTLADLIKSQSFAWKSVGIAKIYATAIESATIASASITSNVVTLNTHTAHGKSVGDVITVNGIGAPYDGTYTVKTSAGPTATSLTYDKTGSGSPVTISTPDPTKFVEGPSQNFYIALDGMRFENINTLNPLYGLTGYSEVRTDDIRPVTKNANSSSLVEFRFGLDVI